MIYRSDLLKKTDAYVKFVSAEPLLTSLAGLNLNGIDWLIVGGESGPGSRPIKEVWVMEMANITNTAFFFKQWGSVNKKNGAAIEGREYKEYPAKKDLKPIKS